MNGAVFGTITDESGGGAARCHHRASRPVALREAQSTVTGRPGSLSASVNLPAGVYRIEYSISGFRTDMCAAGSRWRSASTPSRRDAEALARSSRWSKSPDNRRLSTSRPRSSATPSRELEPRQRVPTSRSIFAGGLPGPGRPADEYARRRRQPTRPTSRRWAPTASRGNMVPLVDGINVLQANSQNGGSSPGRLRRLRLA